MHGKNPVRHYEGGDGKVLQVAEIFYTLQGEGPFSGLPSVFVRLTGCNLRCWFCDTKWDDDLDIFMSDRMVFEQAVEKAAGRTKLLVRTGGEPCRQNIGLLVNRFLEAGWQVQVETAGTIFQEALARRGVTVVCSPKTPAIDKLVWKYVDAFKYVIDVDDEIDPDDGLPLANTQAPEGRKRALCKPKPGAAVYLSPCDVQDEERNRLNRLRVGALALKYGHRAGVQLHKLLELP
jgi:7-carboxy-7-deazaguanine synthase